MPRCPHRVWIAGVAALAFLASPLDSRPAAADDDADVVVRKWLVLAPVDVAARRPLRPDAVFAKHLLDRASPPPKAGEEIVGTLGKSAKWAAREATASEDAKKDGFVEGDDEIGWAYASVESGEERVAIAKLEGAAVLFVGGAGFTGDVYRLGDAGVPVALKKGANDVYVAGTRGAFRLAFEPPELDSSGSQIPPIDRNRSVYPDIIEGESADGLPAATRILNVSTTPLHDLWGSIVPLGVRSPRASLVLLDPPAKSSKRIGRTEPRRRTFVSAIDDSVESYALVPPTPSDIDKSKIGLVLSLHGAGVECMDQAKAYAPKPDFWIVCPTNRGRFGFDWQDWGRLDAYEVLDDALKVTGVDPRRVYLTGHSMGGHGVWHLAANDPDRFLAIAPSAGWCSFETYAPSSQAISPLAWMWRAADGASRTMDLVGNLAQIPTYVLHGEKDDNVPLSEAQLMVDAVTRAGGKPEFHVEPGMGHWWDLKEKKTPGGAACVDWPGIWELFRKTQPRESLPDEESITAADVFERMWFGSLGLFQPIEYGRFSRVHLKRTATTCTISTENLRTLYLGDQLGRTVFLDGQRLADSSADFHQRINGRWQEPVKAVGVMKAAHVNGPFKHAFTNRFVLVYGTAGDESENRELLEKARYDSEVWAYRANGDANLMSDAQFLAGDFKDRNVIVYGNADTNKAWSAVFDDDCPIVAKRGVMTVNGTKYDGVVAAAFVRPRKGQGGALAAAFADTGAAATRLFYSFPVFGSGFGIPDYVVFGPGFLKEMDGDVRAAGWFDYAWKMR